MRLTVVVISALALAACAKGGHRANPDAPTPALAKPDASAPHPALAMRPVPSGLGVNIHWYEAPDEELALIAAAGVEIVRMDVGWMVGEPKPGEYEFSRYDRLIDLLSARGLRLLFIFDYTNPLYDGGKPPCTDAGRAASARFCAAMAARYKGRGVIWELWNEPNSGAFWKPKPDADDYVKWCRAVVKAVREADPDACIVGPATSKIDMDFLDECFSQGFLDLVDGVTVHPYRNHKSGPETAMDEYAELRSMMQGARRPIPVLSGEWGYTSLETGDVRQAKLLARQWLSNLAGGVPISIWYDWRDDGAAPDNREHHFGTMTHDLKPKLAYFAMKTLTTRLKGYSPAGWIRSDGDFVALFQRGSDRMLAAWTDGEPHALDLGAGVKVRSVEGHLGEARPANKIELSDAPCYILLAPGSKVPGR